VRPLTEPIGLEVNRTGRQLHKAFDDALAAAGGSLPMWLILTALKRGDHTMQRDIAAAVGIEDATLTHHLNRMETAGLIARHRPPDNRRTQIVSLTPEGNACFGRLLETVAAFDRRLRGDLTETDLDALRGLLSRLRENMQTFADHQ
jgi:MarR family transcriptional regulator for hemolysin